MRFNAANMSFNATCICENKILAKISEFTVVLLVLHTNNVMVNVLKFQTLFSFCSQIKY